MKMFLRNSSITPGVPTQKGQNASPDVTSSAYPNITLGNYDVPSGWPTNVKFSEPGDVPGPPVQFEDNDLSEVSAGYGFESDNRQENETYFFHTDHLGSTTYLTDSVGNVCQFVWYAPYGEALVDEHVADYENPFKFSGKELDDVTGLYDHGARSRNPVSTLWYGVDPLWENGPDYSPYIYCFANPLSFIDCDGNWPVYDTDGSYLGDNGEHEEGKDIAYVGERSYDSNGIWDGGFKNLTKLTYHHTQFQTIANIVKHEGETNDPKEYLWIAHTANNAKRTTLYKQLMSSYSSVSSSDKKPLDDKDNSTLAKYARAAVIDVMLGNPDPTGGSKFWDGTDFLAKGTKQNKFKEYKFISIDESIFNTYKQANFKRYGNRVRYNGTYYAIPAEVFRDRRNWSSSGFYFSTQSTNRTTGIVATGSFGRSIFWRVSR